MTLKVVVDNTNVTPLPVPKTGTLADMVRSLADELDTDAYKDALSLVSLVVHPGGIHILLRGKDCSPYELMGMFEASKFRVLADDMIEDD